MMFALQTGRDAFAIVLDRIIEGAIHNRARPLDTTSSLMLTPASSANAPVEVIFLPVAMPIDVGDQPSAVLGCPASNSMPA